MKNKKTTILTLILMISIFSSIAFATIPTDDNVVYMTLYNSSDYATGDYDAYGVTGGYNNNTGAYMDFDGTDDYLVVDDSLTTTTWTVSTWIQWNSVDGSIYDRDGDDALIYISQSKLAFYSTTGEKTSSTYTFTDENWHHIVVGYDGSKLFMFIDGSLDTNVTRSITAWDSSDTVWIGAYTTGASYWNGDISDFIVYDKALSQEEVTSLYNNETDVATANIVWSNPLDGQSDYSNNSNNAEANGGITFDVSEQAYDFDGTDDSLSLENKNLDKTYTNGITISKWVNAGTLAGTRRSMILRESSSPFDIYQTYTTGSSFLTEFKVDGSLQTYTYTGISINTWYLLTLTYDGTTVKYYKDGVNVANDSLSGNFDLSTGYEGEVGAYNGATYFQGQISDILIYEKALSTTEIEDIYAEGRNPPNPYLVQPPTPEGVRTESVYQVIQEDIVTIDTDDLWTTIIQGEIAVEANHTNYGSTSIQVLSNDTTEFECRTTVNGNESGDNVNRTNLAGQIGSLSLLRPDINESGTYNLAVQCRKNGGQTIIGLTNGIGHVFDDNVTSNTVNVSTTVDGTNVTITQSTLVSNYTGKLILENAGTISSPNAQTYSSYISTSDGQSCGINNRALAGGDSGAISGLCVINVIKDVPINITGRATGNNVTLNMLVHAKILSTGVSQPLYDVNVTETLTKIGEVTVNNTLRLDKVFMKANIPIHDSSQTVNLRFAVDGVLVGQDIPYTAGNITKQSSQQFVADAPDKDSFNVTLYATADAVPTTDISIEGGNLMSYIANSYDVNSQFLTLTAKNVWDNTSLNNFSVTDGVTTYTTTDGQIDIFTNEDELNLTFSSDGYFDKTYLNHNATIDLEAELGQTLSYVRIYTKYLSEQIQSFTVETENGTFSTTNGSVLIQPNLGGNYTWNITTDNYYNRTGLEFNATSTLNNFVVENMTDAWVQFVDAETSTPFVNKTIILVYPNTAQFNLLTDADGYVNVAGEIDGNNSLFNLTFASETGYVTPITFDFNITSPINETKEIDQTNILIRIYDYETEQLITQNVSVNVVNYFQDVTSNGTLSIQNVSITAGEVGIFLQSDGYLTTQKSFVYTSQDDVALDFYMKKSNISDLGSLFIYVLDEDFYSIQGSDTRLLRYFTSESEYKEVDQCYTNANGECVFNIILGSERYIVTSEKTINDITLSGTTSQTGDFYNVDNTQVEIYLRFDVGYEAPDDIDLRVSVFNTNLTDLNVSELSAYFIDPNGLSHEVCIIYSYKETFNWEVDEEICTTGASGTVGITGGKYLNSSLKWKVDVKSKDSNGDYKKTYYTFFYNSADSFENIFEIFLKPIIIFFMAVILGVGLSLGNIAIFFIGAIVLITLYTIFFPSLINIWISPVLIGFCLAGLWLSRKKSDNGAV